MPKLDAWGATDVGVVRQNNEDGWFIDPALAVAIVADGMGGAACGEVAAALTLEGVGDYLRSPAEELEPEQLIKEAIREANRRVLKRARREEQCEGMGSTIVAALWKLPRVMIANVGDSRAYLWRNGKLTQLSHDQTLANELRTTLGLTEEQMSGYAHKNVLTMAIGSSDNILICTREEILEPGDEVLLCSDGLYGPMSDAEIEKILAAGGTLQARVKKLIEAAKRAGSSDNITAVLLRYGAE